MASSSISQLYPQMYTNFAGVQRKGWNPLQQLPNIGLKILEQHVLWMRRLMLGIQYKLDASRRWGWLQCHILHWAGWWVGTSLHAWLLSLCVTCGYHHILNLESGTVWTRLVALSSFLGMQLQMLDAKASYEQSGVLGVFPQVKLASMEPVLA